MKIYVGNIPLAAKPDAIDGLFRKFGDVSAVTFIHDRESGRFRGFGFVDMPSEDTAIQAIKALSNSLYEGHTLCVNEARPKKPRPPRDTW